MVPDGAPRPVHKLRQADRGGQDNFLQGLRDQAADFLRAHPITALPNRIKNTDVAKEISDNIFMLTLPMPFRLEHVNVYAVVGGGRVSLIDTGLNMPGVLPALEEDLEAIGHRISDIDEVFVTHFHADHCGLAGTIQGISGARVFMDETEYRRTRMEPEKIIGLMQSFYRREGMPPEIFGRISNLFRAFRNATVPFTADPLVPGDRLKIKGLGFEVISTPGHSAHQVIFFCRERGLLFSGDHVLPHITPNLSPDLTNPSFRPLRAFIESLERISDLPVTMVYPAHGNSFPDLKGRVREIREHHEERKQLIIESVRSGAAKTAHEVSGEIFGGDLPDFDQFLALNETYVHLVELVSEGRLTHSEKNGIEFFCA